MKDMTVPPASPSLAQPAAGEELDLARIARALWNRLWIVLLAGAVAFVIGGYYAYRVAEPTYQATATLVLEDRREQLVDLGAVISGVGSDQVSINTELEVMRSRDLIEKMVRRLDLVADPEFNPWLSPEPFSLKREIRRLIGYVIPSEAPQPRVTPPLERQFETAIDIARSKISVGNARGSLIFTITATTDDRGNAARLANTLAELYILEQIEVKFEATAQATEWLTERVASLQTEFEEAQTALRAFTARAELVTPEEIAALNRQIADLRERIANLRGRTGPELQTGDDADAISVAIAEEDWDQLAVLTGDAALERLLSLPRTEANVEALASRAAQIDAQRRAGAAPSTDRAALQVRALEMSLADLERDLATRSANLVELQALQREVEQSRVLFEYFQTRLRETAVQQGIQQADARILGRALVPTSPSAPNKTRILALSAFLGLMLGSAFVIVHELRQTGFRSAEELEQITGLTVMGQLPKAPISNRKGMLGYLSKRPDSRLAEAFRNLRTSVMLSDLDHPPQVIMSTSSLPGEGKTTQALALAQIFSAMGKSVLLVECDIRRRTLTRQLGLSAEFGLLSVLSGEATLSEATQRSEALGTVAVLAGDRTKTNPVDVFSSDSFTRFLEQGREAFDIVLLDTPPVLAVPDARVIGQKVDAVLYAVKWNSTPRSALREGLRLLETVNVKVSGLVLSQIDLKGMERYGYGGYGSYGKGYYRD